MKKLFLVLALLVVPAFLHAETIKFFNSATASATAGPYDLTGFKKASIQVTSVAGSVATITVQKRNPAPSPGAAAGPWSTIITINNPAPDELGYDGPGIGEIQIILTYTSGTINGYLTRSN